MEAIFPYVKKINGAVNVNTASDGLSLARRARLPSSREALGILHHLVGTDLNNSERSVFDAFLLQSR